MTTTVHADSTDEWARSITDNFISLSVTPAGARFQGTLDAAGLGEGITITRVENTPAVVSRTREGAVADACDDVLILTPLHGALTVTQADIRHRVTPGMASVHVAEQPYALTFDEPGEVMVLQAPRRFAPAVTLSTRVRLAAAARPRPLVSVFRAFLEEALTVSDRLTRTEAESIRHTATSLALAVLADGAADQPSPDPAAVALRAQAYIRAHLADPDLTPAHVAAHFHVSLRYLQLAFQHLDTTPARYIRTIRLEYAQQLLMNTAMSRLSTAAIAAAVGYEESTFYRAYKAMYGRTPGDDRHELTGASGPTPSEGSRSSGRELVVHADP